MFLSYLIRLLQTRKERLIRNFTTNLAESWVSIRAKFDGEKVSNRCARSSWNTRCNGGVLRKNLGTSWSPVAFKTATHTSARAYFYKLSTAINQI